MRTSFYVQLKRSPKYPHNTGVLVKATRSRPRDVASGVELVLRVNLDVPEGAFLPLAVDAEVDPDSVIHVIHTTIGEDEEDEAEVGAR